MKPAALIIAPDYPYPPTDGGRLRVYHLVAALAASPYSVDLLALSRAREARACGYPALDRWCQRIDSIPVPFPAKDLASQFRRMMYCIRHRFSPRSDIYANDTVMRRVADVLSGRSYDLVILEHSWIANYYPLVQKVLRSPGITILDLHNIESDLKREFATHSDRFPRTLINRMFSRFAAWHEQRWIPQFTHLMTTSDHDKQRMHAIFRDSGQPLCRSRISVVPNGVDLAFYRSIRQTPGRQKRLLFCGGLDYPPNRTAIDLLVRRVFPDIRRHHRDCELWIVGKDDPHWTKPRADGVIFTGYVDDVRPYLEDATVILAPILNGSGTRFKILEAWAARRPLVATTKAVEGLNATPMTHFWVGDTVSAFIDGIHQILRAPERAGDIVDAAHRFVTAYYDAHLIGERFRKTLEALRSQRTDSASSIDALV